MSLRHGVALLAGALIVPVLPLQAAERDRVERKVGAEEIELDHWDVSPPLRDMSVIPPTYEDLWDHEVKRWPPRHPPVDLAATADPALQRRAGGSTVSGTVGLNFDGVGVGLGTFSPSSAPPDTVGAVGSTQYVQWVNTSFAVFNKSNGALVFGPAAGNTLWQGFGGRCESDNDGDPIVAYDKAANRWIMTQFSVSASPFFQCIAVSTSADATGTYRRFSYQFTDFNDYPKTGVWPDGYYITYNMFNAAGTAFLGSKVCAYDRNQMITVSGTPAPQQCFQLSSTFGGLLPADLDGSTQPPAGAPSYVVAFDDTNLNGLNLWKFHVDWASSANSTLTGPTKITTASFAEACNGGTCIPQPGTTQQLDSLADRLMYRLAYRNFGDHESLVLNHSVNVSGVSGVRWYEIRSPGGTPSVFQQSTFSPDTTYRWMGSIAQDKDGNMLLGYSASSSSLRPRVRYTGRLASDAANSMQAENEMFAGAGSQTTTLSRWGDYSNMTVDPVDDCTFWYTQEYIKSNGTFNWSTRIGSFKFPTCGAAPDFSLSCSPSSLSVQQGTSGTSTCTVTSSGGFSSAVSLSCANLPAGVSCGYSPASVTPPGNGSASSTLTVSVSGSAATGTSTFQAQGTSGSTTHSFNVSLTVSSAPVPDFGISASPASVTVAQGGSGTSTITVSSLNGFSAATSLSASGLPSGVTASFNPGSVTPPSGGAAASTLTLTASATATTGTSAVTVTGTSGSLSHNTSLSLTVTPTGGGGDQAAVFDATLKAPKCGTVGRSCDSGASLLLGRDGKGPEPNQPNTINTSCADGTSGTFHSDESNDRLKVSTSDGSDFAAGKTVRIDATVWAWTTPSSDHLDLYYASNATSPTWTFIATLTPTAAGAQTLSATYTLPSGSSLQAVRATFRYQGSASACGTNSGYDDHDDLVFAVGAGAPDTTPPTTSITAPANGATVGGTVNVTASASDNVGVTRVEFYVDGALASTDTTSPYGFSWVTTGYVNGSSHTLASRAYDAANNVGASGTVTVTVDNSATAQTAVFDSTLRAPKCALVGISCDSGASLLLGRDGKGPEPNQPNTINGSCADGTSGTFHSDESNDRIKVSTSDGSAFAAGKTVRVDATVWAWTTPSSDHLDLYYAANSNSPTWTLIGTLTPTAAGAQTLSATYTLPAGALQAVRAHFRYQGSATSCSTGAYDDHDDLVFAVQ
jgi:hypothetical protein